MKKKKVEIKILLLYVDSCFYFFLHLCCSPQHEGLYGSTDDFVPVCNSMANVISGYKR